MSSPVIRAPLLRRSPRAGWTSARPNTFGSNCSSKGDKGAAILLISEDLDEILALSDRIAVIYEGQIMDILPRRSLLGETRHADGRRADQEKR